MSGDEKAWGGRFAGATAELMERFNASIGFDRKLLEVDIAGSQVHARALERAGVLTAEEVARLSAGLEQVRAEFSAPGHPFSAGLEDVHMAVEHRLTELIGPLGGKLHTGRSRNDQVNLDERLYLRGAIAVIRLRVRHLQAVLADSAEAHLEVILPGYTHLQQAQPILFGHYALALFWMLERDQGRLADAWKRADFLPLGAGALAGSAYPLDRQFMAGELGFSQVTPNSLDAVSDRDFLLEALAALAILMMHLSRFCEDLIIWSAREFGFVELADAFSTGSSMMPQKKNPDSLELVRGKTGRVYGDLFSLLTTMKGLPLTYAKDLQEDKEPLFDAFESVQDCLEVFAGAWQTMQLRPARMEAAVDDAALATDLADYLARQGLPFREAHHAVGRLVRFALDAGRTLRGLTLEELKTHSPAFGEDALALLDLRRSLSLRNIEGGTGPQALRAQLEQARALLGPLPELSKPKHDACR
ncbi:MAG: argininosuccinate lyase [Candidatus Latescibacteria bacterium]|nr:argininosuccinate lyase [Candidatus Latescibacterota bacterium]